MNDAELKQQYDDAFRRSEDAFGAIKQNFIEDSKFAAGEQWPSDVANRREGGPNPRPCIVVNKAAPLVRFVVNAAKQRKFNIAVKAVDDKSDPETAQIYAGLIRNIEYNSRATEAYMWALHCSVTGGLGYMRVNTEYENSNSFDQTLRINKIKNPLSVCWDADSDAIDGRDARVVCLYDYISEVKSDQILYNMGLKTNKRDKTWYQNKQVKVGEMFYTVDEPDELYLLTDGSKVKRSETDKERLRIFEIGGHVKDKRKCFTRVVKWCYIVNGEIVEKTDINGQYIPIVPVYGRESYIDGKRDYKGIVRDPKGSCQMYNYMASTLIEQIGQSPRVPWIGAEGQFEGHPEWADANVLNLPFLEYKPVTIGGQVVPAPQRNNGPSTDPSVERYMMIASEDIKATSGIYDASVGRQGNETSGRAISARAAQGSDSSFDFIDNAVYSIEQVGRICVDTLPRITSPGTVLRVMGEDGKGRAVTIGKEFVDDKTGKVKIYDLERGQYDVECSVTTADRTRRERANELLTPLMSNPDMARLLGDIFVGNVDMKDGEKAARRIKATLPANILAAETEEGDGEEPSPELDALQAEAEKVITQLKTQLEELNGAFEQAKAAAEGKAADIALKNRELDIKQQEVDITAKDSRVDNAVKTGEATTDTMAGEHIELRREVEHLSQEIELITAALENLTATSGKIPQVQQGEATNITPPNNFTLPGNPQSGMSETSGPTPGAPEEPPMPEMAG